MELQACLPKSLRGPTTTIEPIGVGLSGAGVYRVTAGGAPFVLKIAADGQAHAWTSCVETLRAAADAGIAPRVVHVDAERRAIVSELVVDRGFLPSLMDPRTRGAMIERLGTTLARVHALPLASSLPADPRALLAQLAPVAAGAPAFVGEAVARALAEQPPAALSPVTSHNDVNPTNLVWDGERIVLLDWDMAGPNEPLYDLAALAIFLRFDEPSCLRLISAHDGAPRTALPARFTYNRRLIAALCGTMSLHLARQRGHDGTGEPRSLTDFYAGLREGTIRLQTPAGQWLFGLALLAESLSL
jgi:aminoglycoside phosphotransferase (APT) family kinase protein